MTEEGAGAFITFRFRIGLGNTNFSDKISQNWRIMKPFVNCFNVPSKILSDKEKFHSFECHISDSPALIACRMWSDILFYSYLSVSLLENDEVNFCEN